MTSLDSGIFECLKFHDSQRPFFIFAAELSLFIYLLQVLFLLLSLIFLAMADFEQSTFQNQRNLHRYRLYVPGMLCISNTLNTLRRCISKTSNFALDMLQNHEK